MISLKNYRRLLKVTLVLILLVISAGSIVRATGSGMGCPDWPKCFGQWVPPTDVSQLPEDYQDVYLEKRTKKLNRFISFVDKMGMKETADALRNDPSLLVEQEFNPKHTWVEYGNRLVGALSGIGVFLTLVFAFFLPNRPRFLVGLAFLNLILMGIEGWFGSIVVATNLTTWTITLHMLLALVIVFIQVRLLWVTNNKKVAINIDARYKQLTAFLFLSLLIQIILGTEVRTQVDELHVSENVLDQFQIGYFIHRSFSWVILVAFGLLYYMNRKKLYGFRILNWIMLVLLFEVGSGILMSYFDIPRWNQPIHLLSSSILLALITWHLFQVTQKKKRESMIR